MHPPRALVPNRSAGVNEFLVWQAVVVRVVTMSAAPLSWLMGCVVYELLLAEDGEA